jgi:hypothetical protein
MNHEGTKDAKKEWEILEQEATEGTENHSNRCFLGFLMFKQRLCLPPIAQMCVNYLKDRRTDHSRRSIWGKLRNLWRRYIELYERVLAA